MTAKEDTEDLRDIGAALTGMDLLGKGESFAVVRLSGGVSCDVWRVAAEHRPPVVVKRALAKLNVAADWHAPPERSATEVAWMRVVAAIDPRWVPKILGEDPAQHMFAMQFLPPESHPNWKSELAAGASISLSRARPARRSPASMARRRAGRTLPRLSPMTSSSGRCGSIPISCSRRAGIRN